MRDDRPLIFGAAEPTDFLKHGPYILGYTDIVRVGVFQERNEPEGLVGHGMVVEMGRSDLDIAPIKIGRVRAVEVIVRKRDGVKTRFDGKFS
ncbi:hypothetical protein QA640_39295 [Bradyrhizobium sp. CB82]|uniref:hypothetical protein n=1 Tax=Bradyrhizobium sp. CB82 TaxID=3039159 RepID=UPI0024B221EB|nr:hypothetical protein [Bradyrhizobium sp. CB82]WFU40187.1 hypothetical protein QA640_39295 [Bradyrhizobium sp. CB82]